MIDARKTIGALGSFFTVALISRKGGAGKTTLACEARPGFRDIGPNPCNNALLVELRPILQIHLYPQTSVFPTQGLTRNYRKKVTLLSITLLQLFQEFPSRLKTHSCAHRVASSG